MGFALRSITEGMNLPSSETTSFSVEEDRGVYWPILPLRRQDHVIEYQ